MVAAIQQPVESVFDVPDNKQVDLIKRKLGEDQARMDNAENLLDQWIQTERHLPKNYEKNIVRNFLRGAKHDIEKTKRKLENYFHSKHALPEFFSDWDPNSKEITKAFDTINMAMMPKLSEDGCRVTVYSLADSDVSAFDLETYCKLNLMMLEVGLMTEFPVYADILVFDGSNFTASHFVKFFTATLKKFFGLYINAYAMRIKEIHIVNAPSMIETLLTAIRPFIHEKIRKRFIVHKSFKSLLAKVSPGVLPSDFGGDLDSSREIMRKWQRVMGENSDWFRKQEDVKSEQAPMKKNDKFQNQIGVTGSFRRLTID